MQFGPKLNNVSNLVLLLDAADKNSYPGSGTTWTDISGNGNNGTLTNGPTFNSANGGSIVFDGSNDYVSVANASSLTNTSSLSVESWVLMNPSMNVYGAVVGKGTSDANEEYCLLINPSTSKVYFDVGGTTGPYVELTSTFNSNTWYHVVATHERVAGSSTLKIYVNGSLLSGATVSPTNAVNDNATNVSIGCRFDGNTIQTWNGRISMVAIHTRTLSATEVLKNYNDSKVRFDTSVSPNVVSPSGLVVHLDANNTISYPGSGTTWTDLSGNNNNGTLTNGPTFNSANGGSIVFDGTNDYVTGNITNVSVYTFSIFIKITSYKVGGGLICGTGGSLGAQLGGGNTLQFENVTTGLVPTTGQWYHFAFVQSTGSSQLIYVNGTLYATNTGSSSLGSGYSLARREVYGPIYLNCQIGVAQIYNRALSATEVLQAYNAFKSRFGL